MDYEAWVIEEAYLDYVDGYRPAQGVYLSYVDKKIVVSKCAISMRIYGGFIYFPFRISMTEVEVDS